MATPNLPQLLELRSIFIARGYPNYYIPVDESCSTKICKKGGKGLLLPLFGDSEQDWPNGLRIVLYLAGLLWSFLGVAIVADVFMGAIETIVSKKKRLLNKKTGRYFTYVVWNGTIANLTLMALGSSAPEILLGVIEVAGNDFYAGDLGPSTIVGSAAFNLFCISAVCVMAIPDGELRYVKELSVFAVTAIFSVFAYLWLWFIVSLSSTDVVDLWESILTFVFFPILVVLAFMADKGLLCPLREKRQVVADIHDLSREELAHMQAEIQHKHKECLTDEQIAKIIESQLHPTKTRAQYRVGAIRHLTGAHKVDHAHPAKEHHDPSKVLPYDEKLTETPQTQVAVQFGSKSHVAMESDGKVHIALELVVPPPVALQGEVRAAVRTRDGTAKVDDDYVKFDEIVKFGVGEVEKSITVDIVDDSSHEDDEEFFVDILKVEYTGNDNVDVRLGEVRETKVLILDDDGPGCVMFEAEEMHVQEQAEDIQVEVWVKRKGGFGKGASCRYKTEDDTAIAGRDYEEASGELHFDQGQVCKKIPITIKARGRYDLVEHFRVILHENKNGMTFNEKTDGGSECCICTIDIQPSKQEKQRIDHVAHLLSMNWDGAHIGHSNWKTQFVEAVLVNGGDDDEGEEPPTCMDWVMHCIALPWKVLFACIPPSDYCGGWLCFVMALVMIGAVTALIGDLAGLLGCTIGLPDAVTAITFVALGTSLPDTFASKSAATQDEYADASIGNITGSNSVNVFLGIGLSWMAGSIYWASKGWDPEWCLKYRDQCIDHPDGGKFVVLGGDLGASVIVFCICAVVCLGVLVLRRATVGGELGGPRLLKYASAALFVSLWLIYIGISAAITVKSEEDDPCA